MQEFIAVDEFLVGFVTLKIRRFKLHTGLLFQLLQPIDHSCVRRCLLY